MVSRLFDPLNCPERISISAHGLELYEQFNLAGDLVLKCYGFQKSGIKCRGVFTFCTAPAILRCTFCPAVLPSAREMRDIVKNDVTA